MNGETRDVSGAAKHGVKTLRGILALLWQHSRVDVSGQRDALVPKEPTDN